MAFSEFEDAMRATVKPWVNRKAAERADERKADDEAGTAAKELGIASGAKGNEALLQAAQAVARELGRDGAVTIDDVVRRMEQLGYANLRGESGTKAKNWKGAVFDSSEWVCVGSIASRDKTAKGRHVRQWATKGWLKLHPVNGTGSDASAFSLYKVYQEAAHGYPVGTELCMLLGQDLLDSSFSELTQTKVRYDSAGRQSVTVLSLYGIPVYPMQGVGVLVVPARSLESSMRSVSVLCRASSGQP